MNFYMCLHTGCQHLTCSAAGLFNASEHDLLHSRLFTSPRKRRRQKAGQTYTTSSGLIWKCSFEFWLFIRATTDDNFDSWFIHPQIHSNSRSYISYQHFKRYHQWHSSRKANSSAIFSFTWKLYSFSLVVRVMLLSTISSMCIAGKQKHNQLSNPLPVVPLCP